ncbi:MAG: helicase-related protein, partial [Methylophilaceae bacterium]
IEKVCQAGTQVYWVCPLIEESEALQLKTALETFERLSADFPNLKVGLVHGKLKAAEKQQVMQAFYANEIQVLVSTTVIEVGVDVPNASIMVIEHAERMGLSQLHQLRGRVGRGSHKSTCILLFQTPLSQMARARLRVVYENTDGFKIAEEDLRLRGPGEFLGTRQSGLPMLKVADLERDKPVLRLAQQQADQILRQHPQGAQRQILRWLGTLQDLATV